VVSASLTPGTRWPGSNGRGIVHRVRTAYEEIVASNEVDPSVIIQDLSDLEEAIPWKKGKDYDLPIVRNI
jgi:hypothetical protein